MLGIQVEGQAKETITVSTRANGVWREGFILIQRLYVKFSRRWDTTWSGFDRTRGGGVTDTESTITNFFGTSWATDFALDRTGRNKAVVAAYRGDTLNDLALISRRFVPPGLDAYYSSLYGLTRKQLRYMLDPAGLTEEVYNPLDRQGYARRCAESTFPGEIFRVLTEKESREHSEDRIGRLVLEAWQNIRAKGVIE